MKDLRVQKVKVVVEQGISSYIYNHTCPCIDEGVFEARRDLVYHALHSFEELILEPCLHARSGYKFSKLAKSIRIEKTDLNNAFWGDVQMW